MGMPISITLAENLWSEGVKLGLVLKELDYTPSFGEVWKDLLKWIQGIESLASQADPFTDTYLRRIKDAQLPSMVSKGPDHFSRFNRAGREHAFYEMLSWAENLALLAKAVAYDNAQYEESIATDRQEPVKPSFSKKGKKDPQRVFVVHGRNIDVKKDIFNFLRSIGLRPIEWTKAIEMTGKATPYVGEILDVALANAQAIVVVMTPDDEARLREEYLGPRNPDYEGKLTPQARPNVLFEAGLALGREPNRTILVEVGNLRPFSDIAGRHTIRLDNSAEKRQALALRLKTAGCDIDISGTDWLEEGDFDI